MFCTLLYILCNADSVELVPLQQPAWYTVIVNNSNSNVYEQYAYGTHSNVESTHAITISTRNKSHHRHVPIYQQDVYSMNTEQLIQYFADHNYTEDDILSRQDLFLSADYLVFAKQLPKYAEYVTRHYNEYKKFNVYTKFIGRLFAFYKPGFQKTFTRLYQECEQERLARERSEQEQRKLKAQQEQEVRAQQQKANTYCAKIDTVQHDSEMTAAIPAHHQQARNIARTQIKTAGLDTVTRNYSVESDAVTFARAYDITEADLAMLRGNAYEHHLHSEFLEQLHEVHIISAYYALQPNNLLVDVLGHGIAIGMEANRLQQPDTAIIWANFGWKTLEIIHNAGEGLLLWAENTAHMIADPVSTASSIFYGLGMLVYAAAYAIGCTARTAVRLNVLKELEDHEAYAHEINHINNNITVLRTYCTQKLAATSTNDLVKYSTMLAVDIILTPKILMFGGKLCARVVPMMHDTLAHIESYMPHIKDTVTHAFETARTESPVLQTAEGILMKASEGLEKVGSSTANIIKSSRTALEAIHTQYMANLEMELGALRLLFDNKVKGFAEFANKYIKIEYKHILGIEELIWKYEELLKNIKGFHHDFMNTFRNSGLFEFVNERMYEHGFYKATILFKGQKVKEAGTFFPAEWSREKVLEKIYEAYEDFIKSGVKINPERDGKYIVNGLIKEGIEIEMHITQKGKIVTAYPILE